MLPHLEIMGDGRQSAQLFRLDVAGHLTPIGLKPVEDRRKQIVLRPPCPQCDLQSIGPSVDAGGGFLSGVDGVGTVASVCKVCHMWFSIRG